VSLGPEVGAVAEEALRDLGRLGRTWGEGEERHATVFCSKLKSRPVGGGTIPGQRQSNQKRLKMSGWDRLEPAFRSERGERNVESKIRTQQLNRSPVPLHGKGGF